MHSRKPEDIQVLGDATAAVPNYYFRFYTTTGVASRLTAVSGCPKASLIVRQPHAGEVATRGHPGHSALNFSLHYPCHLGVHICTTVCGSCTQEIERFHSGCWNSRGLDRNGRGQKQINFSVFLSFLPCRCPTTTACTRAPYTNYKQAQQAQLYNAFVNATRTPVHEVKNKVLDVSRAEILSPEAGLHSSDCGEYLRLSTRISTH